MCIRDSGCSARKAARQPWIPKQILQAVGGLLDVKDPAGAYRVDGQPGVAGAYQRPGIGIEGPGLGQHAPGEQLVEGAVGSAGRPFTLGQVQIRGTREGGNQRSG